MAEELTVRHKADRWLMRHFPLLPGLIRVKGIFEGHEWRIYSFGVMVRRGK